MAVGTAVPIDLEVNNCSVGRAVGAMIGCSGGVEVETAVSVAIGTVVVGNAGVMVTVFEITGVVSTAVIVSVATTATISTDTEEASVSVEPILHANAAIKMRPMMAANKMRSIWRRRRR